MESSTRLTIAEHEQLRTAALAYETCVAQLATADLSSQGRRQVGRRLGELHETVRLFARLEQLELELQQAILLACSAEEPADVRTLATEEASRLQVEREAVISELRCRLESRPSFEQPDAVVVEIRAGEGGAEAALWAADLLRVYLRYATRRGWVTDVYSLQSTDQGGCREALVDVRGPGVWERLRHEAGTHRVQRVPATDPSGRIHTSTATVAVLPKTEPAAVALHLEDVEVQVSRASGNGGQGVNTTDSAVRLVHRPTGLVVTCQNERSQTRNKAAALEVLAARLLARTTAASHRDRADTRRAQTRWGQRAERIRTYNVRNNRVTDHRLGRAFALRPILDGQLDELVDALTRQETTS